MKNRQRFRYATLAIAASTLLVLSACGSDEREPAAAASPAAEEVLDLNIVDTGNGSKVQIAIDNGFFEKHKLNIKLSTLSNGTAVLAALQGGSADIGYADLYAGINANANRFPVRFIVANNHNTKSIPWLTRSHSGIETPKDLEGKSVGVAPVPQHTVNLRGFLKANGVDASKVKITIIDTQNASQEILQSKAVDAIQGTWPIAYGNEGKEGQYDFRVLGNSDSSAWTKEGATTAGFWATEDWTKKNEEAAQRFADAWREYNEWLIDRTQEERAGFLEKYNGVDVTKLAGTDQVKIDNLIGGTEQVEGFDFEASQEWYDLGVEYAGDRIKPGVDLKDIVWKSAVTD